VAHQPLLLQVGLHLLVGLHLMLPVQLASTQPPLAFSSLAQILMLQQQAS
jgi:hypothetical protein